MSQEAFFAKQEDQLTSLSQLMKHLVKLQGLHQQIILKGIAQHQQKAFTPLHNLALKAPSWQDYAHYVTDLSQRSILFWDTLRQRGDNLLAYEESGFPIQLNFKYETVFDGKSLPNPVNYNLLRILPASEQDTDETLPPIIVVDPRGGHGAGISAFKEESTVGESLRAGHPTYFVAFNHAPEPGQTLETIGIALARFIEWVSDAHPEAINKPVIIGNCQAGWAVMGLAAIHPELPGLIIINGAPLSYWAGAHGRNPMRYSGGLLGGSWLTRLGSDMGNGRFDGTWLVSNFEALNPAHTLWEKYTHLFAQIDTEAPRFLDFERWWSSPILFNSEEIESIVDELFIGNQLVRPRCQCSYTDLHDVQAPVVVFCSNGDDITPPQQALDWIVDLYPDDLALQSAGRVIIYLEHQTIGHLGLFVSSQVLRREHRQMIGAIDAINALPPGLYELVIDETSDSGSSYTLHFEPRHISDIVRQNDPEFLDDEREFALVDKVSEINSTLYDLAVRPWLHQLVNEPIAQVIRQLHPFRQERIVWSSLNPALGWLPAAAQRVRATRQKVAPENPLLAWQELFTQSIVDGLNTWRDIRDTTQEWLFHAFYGGLSTVSVNPQSTKTDYTTTRTLVTEDRNQALIKSLKAELVKGGPLEASIRVLLLLARTASRLDKELLQRVLTDFREEIHNNPETLTAALLKEIAHIQGLLVFAYPQESLTTLKTLLPTLEARQSTLNKTLIRVQASWKTSEEPFGSLWRELYQELELPTPDFALLPAQKDEEPVQSSVVVAAPQTDGIDLLSDAGVEPLPEKATTPEDSGRSAQPVDTAINKEELSTKDTTPPEILKPTPAAPVRRKTVSRSRPGRTGSSRAPNKMPPTDTQPVQPPLTMPSKAPEEGKAEPETPSN